MCFVFPAGLFGTVSGIFWEVRGGWMWFGGFEKKKKKGGGDGLVVIC